MTGTDPLYTSDFTCHNKLSRVEAIEQWRKSTEGMYWDSAI